MVEKNFRNRISWRPNATTTSSCDFKFEEHKGLKREEIEDDKFIRFIIS